MWKTDRLSRSLLHLLQLLMLIEKKGAAFRSMTEAIDTTTPTGRALMQMIGTFSELERASIRERTKAGLAHARANGVTLGRRRKLTGDQVSAALELLKENSIAQAAAVLNVGEATLKRALRRRRDDVLKEAEAKGKQHGTGIKKARKQDSKRSHGSTRSAGRRAGRH